METWEVSIHVPAKGTTQLYERLILHDHVSIHVPAKGTTSLSFLQQLSDSRFNPRSREGNDRYPLGNTTTGFRFQSTFPRRERHTLLPTQPAAVQFQSTFPRRERRGRAVQPAPEGTGFNPRSREGNDQPQKLLQCCLPVSIHVPAKGTTVPLRGLPVFSLVSIHVPAKGTTAKIHRRKGWNVSFNPRSREGNDLTNLQSHKYPRCFNPRSREGNDDPAGVQSTEENSFNPRSREGNDDHFHET